MRVNTKDDITNAGQVNSDEGSPANGNFVRLLQGEPHQILSCDFLMYILTNGWFMSSQLGKSNEKLVCGVSIREVSSQADL